MLETRYDIKDGYVQVPQADYEQLVQNYEDLHDQALLDYALKHIEEFFPGEVMKALLDGENPVRVFRSHRGLTQIQLADRVGVKQATISDLESGKNQGSIQTLKKIADCLDVDLDHLVF